MEKLFQAVRDRHPGCEIVDIRFMVSEDLPKDKSVEQIDSEMAEVVKNATEIKKPN